MQDLLDLFYLNVFRHLYVWLTKKKIYAGNPSVGLFVVH